MPTSTPFTFPSGGAMLAGRMHRRPDAALERQPAVVVTGSWLTVKEQMADRYAAALADLGYTAFTFDFAGFGQSGGAPRQLESPARKVDDIAAAVAYAGSLSLVPPGPPALLPGNVQRIAAELPGAETLWLDGEQTDFYDRPAQVQAAVAAADAHFRRVGG